MRYLKSVVITLATAFSMPALAANIPAKVYRNPNCGCCEVYAKYLKSNGFDVTLVDTFNPAPIHAKYAVPEKLEGCHTTVIGPYVFEGLVPAQYIKRTLEGHQMIKGLSVPGMPVGAPGMPGAKQGPINVYYIDASSPPRVFATF